MDSLRGIESVVLAATGVDVDGFDGDPAFGGGAGALEEAA